jgi:hypothetical protein
MQQNQNDSIIDQQYNWLMKHNDQRQDNGVINEQEHESKSRDESSTHNSR